MITWMVLIWSSVLVSATFGIGYRVGKKAAEEWCVTHAYVTPTYSTHDGLIRCSTTENSVVQRSYDNTQDIVVACVPKDANVKVNLPEAKKQP
jgi:hypothetical protein